MLLEFLDKSIRDAADLEHRLKIRPISAIPYVTTNAERGRRKRLWVALMVAAGLAVAVVLVLLQLFYVPLDLVVQKVLQRLGI